MAFHVELLPQALDDLDSIANYIKTRSSFATAERWFNGIMDDIASLKEMPERCSVAPESEDLEGEVRVLLHGHRNRTYKVYFSVHHETPATGVVSVFHVRHWARKPVESDELEDLMDDQEENAEESQE
jgi:plasmid stabilization system protein ParE